MLTLIEKKLLLRMEKSTHMVKKLFKLIGLLCLFLLMFDCVPYYFGKNAEPPRLLLLMILSNTVGLTLIGGILQELRAWEEGWLYKIILVLCFLPACIVGVVTATLFFSVLYMKFLEVLFVVLIGGVIIATLIGMGLLIESLFLD